MKRKGKNRKGSLAITQILILVVGLIAVSWSIGGVRGADEKCTDSDATDNHPIGDNVFDRGTASQGDKSGTDYCIDDKLIEYLCTQEHGFVESYAYCSGVGDRSEYFCDKDKGACVKKPTESTAKTTTSTNNDPIWNEGFKDALPGGAGYKNTYTDSVSRNKYDAGYESEMSNYRIGGGRVDLIGYNDGSAGMPKDITFTSYSKYSAQYEEGYQKGKINAQRERVGAAPLPTDALTQTATAEATRRGVEALTGETGTTTPSPTPSTTGDNAAGSEASDNTGLGGEDSPAKDAQGVTSGVVAGKGIPAGVGANVGIILKNAGWAAAIYFGVKMFGNMVGLDKDATSAAANAAGVGLFVGKTVAWGFAKWGANAVASTTTTTTSAATGVTTTTTTAGQAGAGLWGMSAATTGLVIGVAIAATIFVLTFKKTKTETVTFECKAWQPATGGNKCEECNKQGILGCNEYQCRSLGQGCQIINQGTDKEMCAWVNKGDVKAPEITTWEGALLQNFKYTPSQAVSPPDRGVKIEYEKTTSKCVPAFTPFTFGISTNEPARCKIDLERKDKFEDMTFNFGGSNNLLYNHTEFMNLPGPNASSSGEATVPGAGEHTLYVKCQDSNGNTNPADFVFKFCVDKGPDTTPPLIVTTSLLNGMPVSYGQQKIDNFIVYTNEPSDCKWSDRDQDYAQMEHAMECSQEVEEMNVQMLYTCKTTLIDLKDEKENKFYFRCKDKAGNVNSESQPKTGFILMGTQALVIDDVGPNGTIKGQTESVRITLTAKTSLGFNEGEATCQFSETGEKYTDFLNTHSYQHTQDLVLTKGSYKYFIKCFDLGGNSDVKEVFFKVESDPYAPIVTRVYRENSNLKLITNEKAECVYSTFATNGCTYDFEKDGTEIKTEDGVNHLASWNSQTTFYIKCKDEYGNKPLPNECSIIVKPLKI